MTFSRGEVGRREAIFTRMDPLNRLKLAGEALEWTVANFATPIADPTVGDLVSRASAAVRDALNRGMTAVPAGQTLYEEIDAASSAANEYGAEPGSFDLLISYYLCFDALAPELTPKRLVVILDHCFQADYIRYSEQPLVVGEPEVSPRGQAIHAYQRDLIDRYTT